MKKYLFMFAVGFTALCFNACGNGTKKVDNNEVVEEVIVDSTEVVEVVDSVTVENADTIVVENN